jgi:hypothetical protein
MGFVACRESQARTGGTPVADRRVGRELAPSAPFP